jgi:UDP-GlcNAc:undecaprenyl-phosphate/decaprenyl-phosphate GlcNAc-1-phosphate transferase
MIYLLIFTILLLTYLLYDFIARYYNIVDEPNERSSHSCITIRGGGIIFPVAAILWYVFFDSQYLLIIAGLILIATISFLDDLYTLPGSIRVIIHFFSVTFLFIHFSLFGLPWYFWIPVFIIFTGWVNVFNFMDGINGMTSFYSLVCLLTFMYLTSVYSFISADLLRVVSISVLIFALFNARKLAKAFAGDVGSVSMAFLLGVFMLSLIMETQRIEYILFFAVYGIDSVFTIVMRLIRRENIFRAHRSHLYQYLSNELKHPQIMVALLFSAVQVIINVITIFMFRLELMNPVVFLIILSVLSAVYLSLRIKVTKAI